MAASFIESLSADFEPTQYRDDYREALLAVIDRKLSGGAGFDPTADVAAAEGDGIVLDLMTALRESVRRTQEARGAASTDEITEATAAKPARKPRVVASDKPAAAKPARSARAVATAKPAAAPARKAPVKAATKTAAKRTTTTKTAAETAKKSTRRSA